MHGMLLVGDSCLLLAPFFFGSIYDAASPMLFHLGRNKSHSDIVKLLYHTAICLLGYVHSLQPICFNFIMMAAYAVTASRQQ
jgi:hypothetical protein